MKRQYLPFAVLVIIGGALSLLGFFANTAEVEELGLTPWSYLPVVERPLPTPTYTPTATNTPIPTNTPGPTNTAVPPTATSTTAPPANVQLIFIEYDPPGDDVDGEYVQIKNTGGVVANMTSWTLSDASAHVYTFPSFNLQPNGVVTVWTKAGVNSGGNLYWSSNAAIWNNGGDTATLKNSGGQIIDTCTYGGGGQNTNC